MGFWRETASIRIQYGNNMETTWKQVNKLLDRVFFSAFYLKKCLTFSKQENKVLNKWRQGRQPWRAADRKGTGSGTSANPAGIRDRISPAGNFPNL